MRLTAIFATIRSGPPIAPDARYQVPRRIQDALVRLFDARGCPADTVRSVEIGYAPAFVRWHFVFRRGKAGSVTRPGRIYTSLPAHVFFALDAHLLHEFFHVVQQWGTECMTIPNYLLHARRREREANEFVAASLREYHRLLREPPRRVFATGQRSGNTRKL